MLNLLFINLYLLRRQGDKAIPTKIAGKERTQYTDAAAHRTVVAQHILIITDNDHLVFKGMDSLLLGSLTTSCTL